MSPSKPFCIDDEEDIVMAEESTHENIFAAACGGTTLENRFKLLQKEFSFCENSNPNMTHHVPNLSSQMSFGFPGLENEQ